MNAAFVRCCEFLARMIEKYGPEIRAENQYCTAIANAELWKYRVAYEKNHIFIYMEQLMLNSQKTA